jgi:hypothetical protein
MFCITETYKYVMNFIYYEEPNLQQVLSVMGKVNG